MVGVDSFTYGKVVSSATLSHRKSVWHFTLISRVSLHCLPPYTATTYLCLERLVPYRRSISRCYNPSMDTSATAGHELLSFINASPTRESTLS